MRLPSGGERAESKALESFNQHVAVIIDVLLFFNEISRSHRIGCLRHYFSNITSTVRADLDIYLYCR